MHAGAGKNRRGAASCGGLYLPIAESGPYVVVRSYGQIMTSARFASVPGVDRDRVRGLRGSPEPRPGGPPPQEPLWREVLGQRLRATRLGRGETLATTAGRAGVSPQYLSEVERGRKEPSSELIAAIAGALGTSLLTVTEQVAGDLRGQRDRGTLRALTPRAVTRRAVTAHQVAPRAVTPRTVAPRAFTPEVSVLARAA